MAIVTDWAEFVEHAISLFPELNAHTTMRNEGDIGALVMQLSAAHELTFAEAAEMVAFRLPIFYEEARLSA